MESYFTKKGIPFVKRDIRHDRTAFREWRDRYRGDIVPMIVIDNGRKIIDGCDLPAIERALREMGVVSGAGTSPSAPRGR